MDFGFGAFLEKIEEHFGKRVLKTLLVLIGLAVALFCGKMIWEIALGPLVAFAVSTVASGKWIEALVKVFWTALAFGGGIGLASLLSANLLAWRQFNRGQNLLDRTEALRDRVFTSLDQAESVLDRAEVTATRCLETIEQAIATRREAEDILSEVKALRSQE